MSQRPWYRPHWATWVAMIVAGLVGLLHFNTTGFIPLLLDHVGNQRISYFARFNLVLLESILLFASTTFVAEAAQRDFARSRQFSVKSLLLFTTVVAATTALAAPFTREWSDQIQEQIEAEEKGLLTYYQYYPFPPPGPLRIPYFLCTACMIYTAGWLALRLIGGVHRLAKRATSRALSPTLED